MEVISNKREETKDRKKRHQSTPVSRLAIWMAALLLFGGGGIFRGPQFMRYHRLASEPMAPLFNVFLILNMIIYSAAIRDFDFGT